VVRIQRESFDASEEVRALVDGRTGIGGAVTFTGFVRGESQGKPLLTLTLEHYPGMTEAELQRIEDEARARFDLAASLIVHRFGVLKPGDPIVLVATVSAHRAAAFQAAEFLMDYLKSRAPFWKKEAFADGSEAWVDPHVADCDALARWDDAPATRK
jgi:molybdopterin synthase catalytic subunit